MKRALTAALALAFVAACSEPDPYANVRSLWSEWPSATPTAAPDLFTPYDASGKGVFFDSYYTTAEEPTLFVSYFDNPSYPSPTGRDYRVDIGFEVKLENTIPVYRFILLPRNLPASELASLPEAFVVSNLRSGAGSGVGFLAGVLPEDRSPGSNRHLVTDWTYCPGCFNLHRVSGQTLGSDSGLLALADMRTLSNGTASSSYHF